MSYTTPIEPMTEVLYGVFQDPALLALVAGGVHSQLPTDPRYPVLWFELRENAQAGGFGTKPGDDTLPELELRIHVFAAYQGGREAQRAMTRAIQLIADPPTDTSERYNVWAIFHDQTIPIPDAELNGVAVHELVSIHRLYVQEAPQIGV